MNHRLFLVAMVVTCIPVVAGSGSIYDASPLYKSKGTESAVAGATSGLLDPDRINLWPMFYYQRPAGSVFWPMIDWREDGHAFRPLYSFYNHYKEWNILWPFVQLDFDRREYFALNTWWDKDSVQSVPFLFYEKDDYWLAPFFAGVGSNWVSIMPPMSGFAWGSEQTQWVFPLYYYNKYAYRQSFVSLLGGWGENKRRTFLNVLGPLYTHAWNTSGSYTRTDIMWPLATHRRTSTEFHLSALPLFWYDRAPNATAIYSFVSLGRKDGSTFVNVLGPLFHYMTTPDNHGSRLRVVRPLFSLDRADNRFKLSSFPLAGYERSGSRRSIMALWPLFHLIRDSNHFDFCSFPLARYERTLDTMSAWALWPVIQYDRYDTRRSLLVLPFFSREQLTFAATPEFHYPTNSWEKPGRWQDVCAVLPRGTQHWTWVFPTWFRSTMFTIEQDPSIPIPPELKADARDMVDFVKAGDHKDIWHSYLARAFTVPTTTVSDCLWPVWDYENVADRTRSFSLGLRLFLREWRAAISNAPLPLSQSDQNVQCIQGVQGIGVATTNLPASSSWRILWRVARSNRDGAALSFESFPFITYDLRPAKELTQFSVCWRLYRYRSEGRRRALDLFFIPIRWEKD